MVESSPDLRIGPEVWTWGEKAEMSSEKEDQYCAECPPDLLHKVQLDDDKQVRRMRTFLGLAGAWLMRG